MVNYWMLGKLGNERPQVVLCSTTSSASFKIDWCLAFHKAQGLSTSLLNHTTKQVLVDACSITDSKRVSPLRFLSFLWCLLLMHLQPLTIGLEAMSLILVWCVSNGVTREGHGTMCIGISSWNGILNKKELSNKGLKILQLPKHLERHNH